MTLTTIEHGELLERLFHDLGRLAASMPAGTTTEIDRTREAVGRMGEAIADQLVSAAIADRTAGKP